MSKVGAETRYWRIGRRRQHWPHLFQNIATYVDGARLAAVYDLNTERAEEVATPTCA